MQGLKIINTHIQGFVIQTHIYKAYGIQAHIPIDWGTQTHMGMTNIYKALWIQKHISKALVDTNTCTQGLKRQTQISMAWVIQTNIFKAW